MGFLRALEFLTIIPSPVRREAAPREVGRSLAYFPVIGLGIGGLLYGLDELFQLALPSALANILLLIALVMVTGVHHLDGFIDTCDGMAAGRSAEERLAIMRDSRVGSLGVVGGCLLLLAKYASLLALPSGYRLEGLILMPVLSRWAMVYAIFGYPYARKM
ncbi:adenosylcobinamide-GDP ribazoletransferase, partial [Chloroflexota bacterium]